MEVCRRRGRRGCHADGPALRLHPLAAPAGLGVTGCVGRNGLTLTINGSRSSLRMGW